MFDFRIIADGLYGLYKGNERITPLPLTREELDEAILQLPLTDTEIKHIGTFYGDAVRVRGIAHQPKVEITFLEESQ